MNIEKLKSLGACESGVDYARAQPDAQAMWQNCVCGDWMLWLLCHSKQPLTKAQAVAIAQDCAKAAQGYAAASVHSAATVAAYVDAAAAAHADECKRQASFIRSLIPNCPEF